jgi:hypothetical protein
MAIQYVPSAWFWVGHPVGQSGPVVYSSAAQVLIADTNSAYVAFKASGGVATPWPCDASGAVTTGALDDVRGAAGLPATGLTPPSAAQLIAYANAKTQSLMAASRTYSVGNGVSVKADATTATGADLISLMTWGNLNPTATQSWVDDFGAVTTLTGAEAVTLAFAVLAYGQSVYTVLGSACSNVKSGSITTTAQIDALAWPT